MVLNAVYAAVLFNKQLKDWRAESPIGEGVNLLKSQDEIDWFSYPEQHKQTGKLLAKVLDGDHLFVNTRGKVCKDGFDRASEEAWMAAAEHDSSIISKAS